MMLFALGGNLVNTIIQNLKNYISTFSSTKGGTTFEAETCLTSDLTELNDYELLESANFILTPNNYSEGRIIPVTPLPTTDFRNLLWRTQGKISSWAANSTTAVVFTGTTDPFGGVDVVRVTEQANTASHNFAQSVQNYIAQVNMPFVLSAYLKKGSLASAPDIMQLSYGNSFANFNITAGTVTFSGSVTNAGIENAGSGWYRCIMSGNSTGLVATNNAPQIFIAFVNNNPTATNRPSYLGATTRDVFIYGAQFELSQSATTYQKNDLYPQTTNNFGFWFNSSLLPYWTNSSGVLQNIPYENIIYPSIGITTVTNGSNWRWIRNGIAETTTGFLAPDGSLTASRMNLGGSINAYYLSYQSTGTSVNGQSFTIPKIRTLIMYVKQGNIGRYLGIDLRVGAANMNYASNATTIKIDTSDGSLANNPTDYSITYSSQSVGNGWYKICINRADAWNSLTMVTNSTLATMANSTDGVLIWRVQVVDGTVDINTPVYDREIAYSIPRIDYTGTSTCPDYLLERSMTNTLLQSENFTAANWFKTNLSVSATTFLSPTNDSYSNLLIATGSTASIKQSGSAAIGLATPRIFSVYLQRKTGSGPITLSMGSASATTNVSSTGWTRNYVVDSPRTGTYTSTSGNFTVTTSTPHGFETADGIRFDATSGGGADANVIITVTGTNTFTFTNGTATTSGNCTIYSNTGKILIDNSGDEVYVWGAQIEFSVSNTTSLGRIPSSYIPTTTAQVTAASDFMATNFSGSSSCSLFFEMSKVGGSNNTSQNFVFVGDESSFGFARDGIGITSTLTPSLTWVKKENGGVVTAISTLPYMPTENTKFKTLLNISGNTVNLWIDGTLLGRTTFANPNNLKYIVFDAGVGNLHGRISKIVSWPTDLNREKIDSLFSYPYYNAGYSPTNYELQDIINRAYAEGFTIPSTIILQHCDTLITEMKNDGVWDLSDLFLNFAYNDVSLSGFSRINWKNPNGMYTPVSIATVFGGMTYRVDGFKGNGVDGYISTLPTTSTVIIPYNYTLNNAGRFMVISEDVATGELYDGQGGTNNRITSNPSSTTVTRINSTNPTGVAINTQGIGFKGLMRDSSTNIRFQNLSTVTSTTQTSTGIANDTQFILRGASLYATGCVSNYYMGASLTNSQMSNFRTYYNTFLTNIGLTAFA